MNLDRWVRTNDNWVQLRTGQTPPELGQALPGFPLAGEGFALAMYTSTLSDTVNLETVISRQFDGIARYRDSNAWTAWPLSEEQPYIDRGRLVRYPIESRVFNMSYTPPSGVPAPTWSHTNPANSSDYHGYRHVDITSGTLDPLLNKMFTGIKDQPGTFIIDWDHEMDDNRYILASHNGDWGPITYNRSAAYTDSTDPDPAEFVAAHRYIVDYGRNMGVTNVIWGWCPAGWTLSRNSSRLAEFYPGDDWVDLIMWDPYNGAGSWRSFADIVTPFYNAIDSGLFGSGSIAKGRFLGEFGCRTGDSRRGQWLVDMAEETQNFPKLLGGMWFSSGTWGAIHGSNGTTEDREALAYLSRHRYLDFTAQTTPIVKPGWAS